MSENQPPMTLSQWRKALKLTQAEASASLGIELRTWQKWEAANQVDRRTWLACQALTSDPAKVIRLNRRRGRPRQELTEASSTEQ